MRRRRRNAADKIENGEGVAKKNKRKKRSSKLKEGGEEEGEVRMLQYKIHIRKSTDLSSSRMKNHA